MIPIVAALSNDKVGKTIQYVTMGGVALAVVAGGVWIAKKSVQDARQDKSLQKSLEVGNAAYFAGMLGKALYTNKPLERLAVGGIDEAVVFSILQSIPKGMMNQVIEHFKNSFKITLAEELDDKLWLSEYQKALAIIETKY